MNDFNYRLQEPVQVSTMILMKKISVAEAAIELDIAPTTVYGMITRKELTAHRDKTGHICLELAEVKKAPRRHRGHPLVRASDLVGKIYANLLDQGKTPQEIAQKYRVTHQAVSREAMRYREAMVREAK